jgi:hypothetical protein
MKSVLCSQRFHLNDLYSDGWFLSRALSGVERGIACSEKWKFYLNGLYSDGWFLSRALRGVERGTACSDHVIDKSAFRVRILLREMLQCFSKD